MCPQYNANVSCSYLVKKKGLQFFVGLKTEVVNYMQYHFYAIVNCIKILQKKMLMPDFLY